MQSMQSLLTIDGQRCSNVRRKVVCDGDGKGRKDIDNNIVLPDLIVWFYS